MRLLKGIVLGLLLERGLCQTDTQPDGDSIATVADPVETDPADVPAPDPTVPSDGDTPSDPPDPADDGPTITLDDPQPTDDGSDARIPAPDPTDQPTDVENPSAIPDDPAETNTDDEQQAPTDQPAPTDTEPAPAATDVDATQTDEETPQETDTNGEEATQTDGDTDAAPVVPTEALNSAAEETPEATPLASDTADDQVPQTTEEPSDGETEEPTADSEPEESTQQKTRNLVAPTNTEKSDAKTTDGDGNYSPAPYASPTGGDEAEQTGDSEQTADGTTRKAAATGSGGKEEKTTLATSKGAAPTSPAQDYAIDLKEADLGDYAEFQGAGDKTVVVLKPPPNTEAKCDLPPTSDEDVPEGEDVRVVLAVKIADLKKGVKSGNRLQMLVDGSTIYDKELLGTGDEEESISSDKFRAALDQKVNVIHKAGDKPVQVTIQDANIRSAVSAGSRGGSGGGSGSGSGSGDDGDDSGDGDSGSGGGGSGSGSGGGSGSGSGDSDSSGGGGASESASGTGDEGASPSSVSGGDGQTNVAGKNFMVGEVLMYALPLAVALVG